MIKIENVSKNYGSFDVLKDCSTTVNKGEVVVVCGPSGSGKSTLVRLLLRACLRYRFECSIRVSGPTARAVPHR